ncbi:MAG: hypothetical protein Q8S00_13490, partial [Deltaproteobacteria bacterium]|nr:hypothetical protein [Deltaproteobacteria bacterium]MDZ4343549.1 hypothetical protein [Candidatus Binatia bacterium]
GKPAVRNFREGGGNVLMIWWPFAPKLERADTLEVTDLHSDAPPLYSTGESRLLCIFAVKSLLQTGMAVNVNLHRACQV